MVGFSEADSVEKKLIGYKKPRKVYSAHFLRLLHWSTLGQIKHSSVLPDGVLSNPLKCAHLAGESKTIGYSVGFTLIILDFSAIMSSFDMQKGQA